MISKTTLTAALPSSTGRKLGITYVPIDQLKPDPKNARVHSKKQIRQIAKSIESFGFNVPVLVGAKLNVIAGHGRVLAAKHLGLTEVPTIRLDHLTEAQRRAFTIADNRLTEIAVWDDRLLAEQLKELASVDLEATGYDLGEIDFRIESLLAPASEPTEPPIPVVSGPAVSQAGDLWLLGEHRVLCGSALDAASYMSAWIGAISGSCSPRRGPMRPS
jgi:ParB-like chromosome segregation protein Spo0J